MRWGNTLGAFARRWYVAVLGLLATVGLAFAAWQLSPPTYTAQGTELLLPPASQVSQGTQNPLLELGSLDAPASLVMAQLNGQDAREEIEKLAPDADFAVEPDPSLRGPTILVTMTDTTPEGALATLGIVLDKVPALLTTLQSDLAVPEEAQVGSMRLAVDADATPEYSDTLRVVVLAVGAGLAATIVIVVAIDVLLRRIRRRHQQRSGASAGGPADRGGLTDGDAGGAHDDAEDRTAIENLFAETDAARSVER